VVSKLSNEYHGRITVAKLDVRYNPQKTKEYNVDRVPTSFFFKDGKPAQRLSGYLSYENLQDYADGIISGEKP
jgi:thioredoxin 1